MLDNAGTKLGTEMLDTQFASKMTGLPGGLADVIARQLERQMGGAAAAPAAPAAPAGAAGAPPAAPAPTAAVAAADRLRQQHTRTRRARPKRQSGIPAAFMVAQAAHESGWGQQRDPQRRRQRVAQPVRHQGRRRAGPGRSPRSRPPNTSTARRRR